MKCTKKEWSHPSIPTKRLKRRGHGGIQAQKQKLAAAAKRPAALQASSEIESVGKGSQPTSPVDREAALPARGEQFAPQRLDEVGMVIKRKGRTRALFPFAGHNQSKERRTKTPSVVLLRVFARYLRVFVQLIESFRMIPCTSLNSQPFSDYTLGASAWGPLTLARAWRVKTRTHMKKRTRVCPRPCMTQLARASRHPYRLSESKTKVRTVRTTQIRLRST
jgi:hypothetical protein